MMKTFALLSLVAVAGAASAQTARIQNPLRVQVGAQFPGDSSIRDNIADAGLYAGVSYDLYQTGTNARGQYIRAGLFLDGAFLSGSGIDNVTVAFGAQGRFYVANSSNVAFYLGAGIGAYYFRSDFGLGTADDTKIGGKLFLGGEFSSRYFAELGVNFAGDFGGTRSDFYTASVGVKF